MDSSTRCGKVARLPFTIREQLNRRIQNGEEGRRLVEWLNSLPETQSVLAAQFNGHPVTEQNLSAWKAGGYRDWEEKQEALDIARSFCGDPADLDQAASLTETLAFRAAAHFALILRDISAAGAEPAQQIESLALLCRQIRHLRRGDHEAQWLQLERQRLALQIRRHEEQAAQKTKSNEPADPITKEDIKLIEKRLNLL